MNKKQYNWLREILNDPPYFHRLYKTLIKHHVEQQEHRPIGYLNCSFGSCQTPNATTTSGNGSSPHDTGGTDTDDYTLPEDFYNDFNFSFYDYDNNQDGWLSSQLDELYAILRESQWATNIALTIFLAVIFFIGLSGNILVLTVFSRSKLKQASTILIMALAGTDLIICAVVLPGVLLKEWYVPFKWDALCRGWELIRCATIPLSSLILVVVAVDRYVLICRVGEIRAISNRRAKIIILLVTFVSTCLGIPPMLRVGVYQQKEEPESGTLYLGLCMGNDILVGQEMIDHYWQGMAAEFWLVLVIVIVLYSLVFRTVYKQSKRWASGKCSSKSVSKTDNVNTSPRPHTTPKTAKAKHCTRKADIRHVIKKKRGQNQPITAGGCQIAQDQELVPGNKSFHDDQDNTALYGKRKTKSNSKVQSRENTTSSNTSISLDSFENSTCWDIIKYHGKRKHCTKRCETETAGNATLFKTRLTKLNYGSSEVPSFDTALPTGCPRAANHGNEMAPTVQSDSKSAEDCVEGNSSAKIEKQSFKKKFCKKEDLSNDNENMVQEDGITSLDDGHYSVLNATSLMGSPESSAHMRITTILSCSGSCMISRTKNYSKEYETSVDPNLGKESDPRSFKKYPKKMDWLRKQTYKIFLITKAQRQVHKDSVLKLVKRQKAKVKMINDELTSESNTYPTDSMCNQFSVDTNSQCYEEKSLNSLDTVLREYTPQAPTSGVSAHWKDSKACLSGYSRLQEEDEAPKAKIIKAGQSLNASDTDKFESLPNIPIDYNKEFCNSSRGLQTPNAIKDFHKNIAVSEDGVLEDCKDMAININADCADVYNPKDEKYSGFPKSCTATDISKRPKIVSTWKKVMKTKIHPFEFNQSQQKSSCQDWYTPTDKALEGINSQLKLDAKEELENESVQHHQYHNYDHLQEQSQRCQEHSPQQLRKQLQKKSPRQHQSNEHTQQSSQRQLFSRLSSKRYSTAQVKTAKVLLLVTVVYVLSFAPVLLMTLGLVPSHPIPFYGYFIHSAANPLIYSFINQAFRKQLGNLFRRKKV